MLAQLSTVGEHFEGWLHDEVNKTKLPTHPSGPYILSFVPIRTEVHNYVPKRTHKCTKANTKTWSQNLQTELFKEILLLIFQIISMIRKCDTETDGVLIIVYITRS